MLESVYLGQNLRENGGKMKEEKVICARCKVEVLVPVERQRLEWVGFTPWELYSFTLCPHWDLDSFILCPHCVHELKQFLAGHATSTVKEVR